MDVKIGKVIFGRFVITKRLYIDVKQDSKIDSTFINNQVTFLLYFLKKYRSGP